MKSCPRIEVHDHCPVEGIDAISLGERAGRVLPLCLAAAGAAEPPVLGDLAEIEVSLVSDEAIAAVHGEFMDDPTPTDVITFHHGELLISAETAVRESRGHRHPPEREALLYLIHGLLHLNGHDDRPEGDRAAMQAEQERILDWVWPLRMGENRG